MRTLVRLRAHGDVKGDKDVIKRPTMAFVERIFYRGIFGLLGI